MKIKIKDRVSVVIEGGPCGSATIIQAPPKDRRHDCYLVRFDDTSLGWEMEEGVGGNTTTRKKYLGKGGFYWVEIHEIHPWLGPEDVVDVD